MSQNVFNFIQPKSWLQNDFIVSSSNIDAYRMVTGWPRLWGGKCLLVTGDKASGKTYLTKIWKEISGATTLDVSRFESVFSLSGTKNLVVEDIEKLISQDEEKLFHVYNNVMNSGGYLLLTASIPLLSLPFSLPDMRSRIASAGVVNILAPDNELLKGLIFKQFSDMQVAVPPSVIDFLIPRVERSFSAVTNMVELINKSSLQSGRAITIPFVKEILGL